MLEIKKIRKNVAKKMKLNDDEKKRLMNKKDTIIKKVIITRKKGKGIVFVEITNPHLNNNYIYRIIGYLYETKFVDVKMSNYNNCLNGLVELTITITSMDKEET